MSNLRLFLLLGLFTVGFLIWQQWQIDYAPRPEPGTETDAQQRPAADTPPEDLDVPSPGEAPSAGTVPDTPEPEPETSLPEDAAEAATVRVRTDVLDLELSTQGGTVVSAYLLEYPVSLENRDDKVRLLAPGGRGFYVAQTGLISDSHQAPDHRQIFQAEKTRYLMNGQDQLVVPFTWTGDGITVVREYVFSRGEYAIEVRERIENASDRPWNGGAYRQLQRVPPNGDEGNAFSNPERFSFTGPAFYTPDEKYQKFDFDDLSPAGESDQGKNAWLAMVQHYFISAWIPPADQEVALSTAQIRGTNRYLVRGISPAFSVAPGASTELESTLFIGPKLQDQLDELAPGLALTVDYGIFTPFSKILFWLLEKIHMFVGNWGWAIVILTILVKAVFFKLTEAQYRSMAKLRKLQPRIQSLKERFGDDKQKFNMKMMEIYKQEKVNPLGGCLPVLIQIPVFIALYWVLVESVELRQAPFILWIKDLSSPDPYFILPVINGAAMFMTTKLSPNPAADPIQQKIMLSMPIVFSVMFAFFQAGLVLYWAVNASLSLAQQWVITKRIDAS